MSFLPHGGFLGYTMAKEALGLRKKARRSARFSTYGLLFCSFLAMLALRWRDKGVDEDLDSEKPRRYCGLWGVICSAEPSRQPRLRTDSWMDQPVSGGEQMTSPPS
jgi:hypothetical protein